MDFVTRYNFALKSNIVNSSVHAALYQHRYTHVHTFIKITHQTCMNKNIKEHNKTVVDQDSTLIVKS